MRVNGDVRRFASLTVGAVRVALWGAYRVPFGHIFMTLQHGKTQNAGANIDILSTQRIRIDLPNVCTALFSCVPWHRRY